MVLGWSLRANNGNQRTLRCLIKSTSMRLHDNRSEYCEFNRTYCQELSTFLCNSSRLQLECTKSCAICRWYWWKFSSGVKSTIKLNFHGQLNQNNANINQTQAIVCILFNSCTITSMLLNSQAENRLKST